MTNQTLPCRDLRSDLLKAIGGYLEQHDPDCRVSYDAFTDHVLERITNTRAQSYAPEGGEAVAWLEVEPGVSLEKAVSEYGTMCYSMRVHVGRKRPDVAQDSNGLFPLYTSSNAQDGQVTDDMALAASNMFSRLKKRGHSQLDAIKKSVEAALSAHRSNDKGTEGG
jgi:hypothetical protein